MAEVLRISCTAPIAVDHKALTDVTVDGYTIPKGTLVSAGQGPWVEWLLQISIVRCGGCHGDTRV